MQLGPIDSTSLPASDLALSFASADIVSIGSDNTLKGKEARMAALGIISGGMGLGAINLAGGVAAIDVLTAAGPEMMCVGVLGAMAIRYLHGQSPVN